MAPPRTTDADQLALIGVTAHRVPRLDDQRGSQSEAYPITHAETDSTSGQIMVFRSMIGVLRGVHAHPRSDIHLSLIDGTATLGLHDLRPSSSTYGRSLTIDIGFDQPVSSVRVPAGVAYGMWFVGDSLHTMTTVRSIGLVDEFACRFDDPGLGINWTGTDPVLSTRDALAGSLNALRASVASSLR